MFFTKKNKLRIKQDEKLLVRTEEFKQQWLNLKRINDKSFSYQPIYELQEKITEKKYLVLLRELKYRKNK